MRKDMRTLVDVYLEDLKGCSDLISREDEHELATLARRGDMAARDAMVKANLRYVVSVAKQFQGRGMALEDLIGAGNRGLLMAAERFDPGCGVKFITYAVWWIRSAMQHAYATEARLVRLPLNQMNRVLGLRRAAERREQAEHRNVGLAAAAEGRSDLSEQEVALLEMAESWPMSLNAPVSAEDEREAVEYLADDGVDLAAKLDRERLCDCLCACLRELSGREQQILARYYGLDGGDPGTLEEIGALLGLTRERIRQLKDRALDQLRKAATMRQLVDLEAEVA
jgi:RNA polymerase primary sigma factor